jgi:hypothetical protein
MDVRRQGDRARHHTARLLPVCPDRLQFLLRRLRPSVHRDQGHPDAAAEVLERVYRRGRRCRCRHFGQSSFQLLNQETLKGYS